MLQVVEQIMMILIQDKCKSQILEKYFLLISVPVDGYSVMDHYFCDPKIENNIKVTIIRMHPTSRQLNKIETSI